MKRLWIGIAVLVAVLAMGIALTAAFARLHYPLAETLEQAAEAALAEDPDRALALSRKAREDWEAQRHFTAAVADHAPLEEMDSLFSQLEVWEQLRDWKEFAATCAHLAGMAEAMAESQAITWWNLL